MTPKNTKIGIIRSPQLGGGNPLQGGSPPKVPTSHMQRSKFEELFSALEAKNVQGVLIPLSVYPQYVPMQQINHIHILAIDYLVISKAKREPYNGISRALKKGVRQTQAANSGSCDFIDVFDLWPQRAMATSGRKILSVCYSQKMLM